MTERAVGPARALLLALARRAARTRPGTLVFDEGARGAVEVGSTGPRALVRVHDPRAYAAVLAGGSLGIAQSYAQGWWDTDDLTAAIRVAFSLSVGWRNALDRVGRTRAAHLLAAARAWAAPSAADDKAHIAAHYDLSDELFALMLDPTMAYSCAVFDSPSTSLEEAQVAKFDRLATMLRLGPDDHVVEIGTGWGGLSVHLAEHYGCRVTTTTISENQRQAASKRVVEHGVADKVTVLGDHYRDLAGSYDALVSVEMIEAVDWRHHDEFFACCARLLKPDGRMALQAITIADASFERAKQHQDFVRRMIFPGGCIPSVASIAASVARATDLRIVELDDIGAHYAETLRRWRDNLTPHRAAVKALGFDDAFWRRWTLYLADCEAAFIERHISDVQVLLARPAWRPGPAVRPR